MRTQCRYEPLAARYAVAKYARVYMRGARYDSSERRFILKRKDDARIPMRSGDEAQPRFLRER